MTTPTRAERLIRAPRATVYRALTDGRLVQRWMVPDGMRSEVHVFDARVDGRFRISLTYDAPTGAGKTTAQTDSFHGRFSELVPDQRVVQVLAFETDDPRMQGEMRMGFELLDAPGGTLLRAVHEGVPEGVNPADNEVGWAMSMDKLVALAESGDA